MCEKPKLSAQVPFARWCRAGKQPSGALEHCPAAGIVDVIELTPRLFEEFAKLHRTLRRCQRAQFLGEPIAPATKRSLDVLKHKLAGNPVQIEMATARQSWESTLDSVVER